MPVRPLSMHSSNPSTPAADSTNRRKSGRAVTKPVLYQQDPNVPIASNGSGKRKRAEPVVADDDRSVSQEESSQDDESEPDEEELKEQRRRHRKAPTKPAAKKPKTTGDGSVKLPMRPATNGMKKPARPRKSRAKSATIANAEGNDLYADVFYSDQTTDEVAAAWIESYGRHPSNAVCDLVNYVLKCTGCDLQVDVHDIEDPDNAPNKIQDLQEEYQAQTITDYPLVSKVRGVAFSRAKMVAFMQSVIGAAHDVGILYSDTLLIENIQIWVTTMTSCSIRPFRHTATVLVLAIGTAICENIKAIVNSTATTMRQKEGEEKKKTINKGRIATLKAKLVEDEKKRSLAAEWLDDIYKSVFIHRYRDIDPKVRVDCVAALGGWIYICPDIFFEGSYLRYLGWVLSDVSAPTRGEVIKQLLKLFKHKENVGRLRVFTERFRPRMVEMAAQDAEPSIRASAIELLDMIRDIGLLEPDDIDTIGRLIFDSEPRVRKAVAGFFAENIKDVYDDALEELGGDEALDEVLGEEAADDYDTPRRAWLKLKCLAEVLESYDADNDDDALLTQGMRSLIVTGVDSRYSMAAHVVCEGVPDAKYWQALAGYLLYDHSSISNPKADLLTAFKKKCRLSEKEERLLLEVLHAAVKLRLTEAVDSETDKKGKKTKARKDESREIQEATALHLAQIIPRLLGKFGANPLTAVSVLRLEPILNLEIFQELRQDSTEYASLLDEINKQFLTHGDPNVIAEASTALLHARGFDDLEEVTESKMQELWEDTIGTLRQLSKAKVPRLTDLGNTVHRISNLASISDCVEIFESETRSNTKGAKAVQSSPTTVVGILLAIVRGYGGVADADADELVTSAIKALLFYYMWTARTIREELAAKASTEKNVSYDDFSVALADVFDSRPELDDVSLSSMGTLLDLHTLFATFRNVTTSPTDNENVSNAVSGWVREVTPKVQQLIEAGFIAAEKAFAKKAKRVLEPPADDDPPDDLDSEPEDSSDEDEVDEDGQLRRAHHRQQELLLAEKRLCELTGKIVLAMLGGVIDATGPSKGQLKKRIQRNKARLGPNFKEVVSFLEEPKPKKSSKAKAQETKPADRTKRTEKSKELVEDDEDEDEIEEVVEEGGEEDLRRKELQDEIEDASDGNEGGAVADAAEDDIMGN